MELSEVLESRVFVKEGAGSVYNPPSFYIKPFLDMASKFTEDFVVKTDHQVVNANDDKTKNVAYGRVLIEAVLPAKFDIVEHKTVVGLVYALDVQQPIIKVYAGRNAHACTNLAIFDAEDVFEAKLLGNMAGAYKKAGEMFDTIEQKADAFAKHVERLKAKEYDELALNEKLGYIIRKSIKSRIGITPVSFAVRELEDSKSVYAIKNNKTTAWNVMSAMTQFLTDKGDIVDKADRTLLISRLFEN
jgi:hypothetical protein